MSAVQKNEFTISILIGLGLLGAIALIYLFVLAMAKDGFGLNMQRVYEREASEVTLRIKPVFSLADLNTDAAAKPVEVVATKSPEELFNGVCAACHNTGVAGAPKLEQAAWESRYTGDLDALVQSAIHGKGAMPPRGGSGYSDDEMHEIVSYMLTKAGIL